MLTVNPYKRITAAEALKHPWICVSPHLRSLLSRRLSLCSHLWFTWMPPRDPFVDIITAIYHISHWTQSAFAPMDFPFACTSDDEKSRRARRKIISISFECSSFSNKWSEQLTWVRRIKATLQHSWIITCATSTIDFCGKAPFVARSLSFHFERRRRRDNGGKKREICLASREKIRSGKFS